jgi:hypothetical protein
MHRTPIPLFRKTSRSRRLAKCIVPKIVNRSQERALIGAPDRSHYHCQRQKLLPLNIRPTCRFHQLPNRRHLRRAHGPAFTPELAQVLARRASPKPHSRFWNDRRRVRLSNRGVICVPLAPTVNRSLQAQLLRRQRRHWHRSLALERPLSSPKGAAYRHNPDVDWHPADSIKLVFR